MTKFDEYINRRQYPTMKWNHAFLEDHFGNPEALPMSVADMDIKSPPEVIEQLQQRAAHGIFGYEYRPESLFAAMRQWYQSRHGWEIDRQHIEPAPSILSAIAILINQHSEEGEGVIIQPPVFFEFRMVIRSNRRKVVKNPLKLVNGKYQMDFDDLEAKAADPRNKILILCNPHNPVGRVWTEAELAQVAEICTRHQVFVISDEIHGDFAFPPHRYRPFLAVPGVVEEHTAVCLSPGKTFNISGIVDAVAVIPNEEHRSRFRDFAHRFQINRVNVFSTQAMETAYQHGAQWLDALLLYLQGNIHFIQTFLQTHPLNVSLIEPEGTFLAWLDFRELGMDAKALEKFLAQEAGLALSPGHWFGREGAGFARMTIATPRATLQRAFESL
ncbi:MAG: pyridoxal phosphate-dependent aminotransferase, partial [Anaerolineae bacterium]